MIQQKHTPKTKLFRLGVGMGDLVKRINWFLSEKKDFLIVSLSGTMDDAITPDLDACSEAILKSEAKKVILHFQNIRHFTRGCIRHLTQFEKQIRDKPAQIRICFLDLNFEKFLMNEGVVRNSEIAANLIQALQSFTKPKVSPEKVPEAQLSLEQPETKVTTAGSTKNSTQQ